MIGEMVTLSEMFGRDEPTLIGDLPELEVVLDATAYAQVGVELYESRWMPSAVSGLFVRVDPERPEIKQERHVHIAQKKHLRASDQQASWNESGKRHDRHSFNTKFGARADVKDVARAALGLPAGFLLESAPRARQFLAESWSDDTRPTHILVHPSPASVAQRIAAAVPPNYDAVALEELRRLGDHDIVLRVIDTNDERVAIAYRCKAVWGPKISISREIVADSVSSARPIGPRRDGPNALRQLSGLGRRGLVILSWATVRH